MSKTDERFTLKGEALAAYIAYLRRVAAAAKASGYVGQPVPLDPNS